MEQIEIVQKGHPALHKEAKEVSLDLIGGKTINEQIEHMKQALRMERGGGGIALAAPQIGVSRRLFIVLGELFGHNEHDRVFINPVITKYSKKTKLMDEGCLSARYCYGQVKRSTNVTVSYYDEHGKHHTRGAGGLLAHVIQHEVDHLNGTLFLDKAESFEELQGKDRKEFDRQRNEHIESINDEK